MIQTTAWQHHFDVITTWILRSASVACFTHAFRLGWWFRYLRLENMHCHHTLQSQNLVHIFLGLSVRFKGKWGLRLTSLHYHGVSNNHKIEILLKRFYEASMKENNKTHITLVVSVLAAYSLNGDLHMLCIVYILVPTLLYTNHCPGSPLSGSQISLKIFLRIFPTSKIASFVIG